MKKQKLSELEASVVSVTTNGKAPPPHYPVAYVITNV